MIALKKSNTEGECKVLYVIFLKRNYWKTIISIFLCILTLGLLYAILRNN